MTRQDLRNDHPFHIVRERRPVAESPRPAAYKRGLRHWFKARAARIRLALGV